MSSRIVTGAIVGKSQVTLFFEDGTTENLPQDHYRTSEIMEFVAPCLARMKPVAIDIDNYKLAEQIKAISGGIIEASANSVGDISMKIKGVEVPVEALMPHIERAVTDGAKGFQAFLKKFAEIKRQHTSKELLEFLKGADLPITDDGSILGFKILRESGDEGVMVDPHTKTVKQRLGSLVYMPDSKVDDDRRIACSTGLHIAARTYLSGFWSDGDRRLCLVKIQPKDVIAVPLNKVSKMRVSAYHIVKVLSKQDGIDVVRGKQLQDIPGAAQMLFDAVAGNHGAITERVEVGARGTHTITPVAPKPERIAQKIAKKVVAKAVSILKKLPSARSIVGPKVDPKDIRLMNKLIRNQPKLADQDPKYLKKLVKAQRMLEDGESLRTISTKLKVDRDALSRNLIRDAA